jgi:hypothetical protein
MTASFKNQPVTVLTGHTSEATAHVATDYPYGRLRCQRRTWIEHSSKNGYRFVAQTQNPKTMRWNKPAKSTYLEISAAMYLDQAGHVHWTGIGIYSSAAESLEFAQAFGSGALGLDALGKWSGRKADYCSKLADGTAYFLINGEKQTASDVEVARHKLEAETWGEVARLANGSESRLRYAPTYESERHGLRTLLAANQARHHFDSREAAEQWLESAKSNGLPNVLSATELASVRVDPIDCYASGDAKGIYV